MSSGQASVRPQRMAEIMGVSYATIRKWAKNNQIPHHRTPGGQLFFTPDDVREALGDVPSDREEIWYYYTRSSQGRTSALQHQEELLATAYPHPRKVIKDRASGLNENRKGLQRLMELARQRKVTDIAMTTQDRLSRFGYKYLEAYFEAYDVKLHCLNKSERESAEAELMADFMALIASFSGRFYQQRNKENMKRLVQAASEELDKDSSEKEQEALE